jgi:RNA polymerase sigma-70 factor (ECF subfamily)
LENGPRLGSEHREVLLDDPEGQLLESCRRGEVAAFETLYEQHGSRMKSLARNLLGTESDAEDAVQETFLKVYRGAASFRGSAALSTWIYRILVNTCYDLLRRRRRRAEEPLEPSSVGSTSGAPADRVEGPALPAPSGDHPLRLAIEQSLGKLAPRQRTVFLLAAVEGFSHREIADVLDVSEGASRTRRRSCGSASTRPRAPPARRNSRSGTPSTARRPRSTGSGRARSS